VLHAPRQPLWRANVSGPDAQIAAEPLPTERLALIGVRGCEAAAIAIQDRVLLGGAHRDPYYGARRDGAFLVAVNCGSPAATCFCTSMGTGPAVGAAHDLVLTELLEGGPHRFLAAAGSAAGHAMLAKLPLAPATASDCALAGQVTDRAAAAITRKMATEGLRDLMLGSLDHPRWDAVAERCLTCGNCTMACPTCFCTTAQDENDLVSGEAVRSQHWASCFAVDFAYIHGGSVRSSPSARYRQWITHKLGTWWDQFGSSGCVGCGRCITWCPVGIDITEEVAALRGDAPAAKGGP
jgi:ferredoxin